MERSLFITDFRNIGITKPQRLVLNNFDDKLQAGSLVIIVGPNNTGKSNYLDALECYGKKSIGNRDVTKLSFDKAHAAPQLSLSCKDESDEYTYRIKYGNSTPQIIMPEIVNTFLTTDKDIPELVSSLKELDDQITAANRRGHYNPNNSTWTRVKHLYNDIKNNPEGQPYDMNDIRSRAVEIVNSMNSWYENNRSTIYGQAWEVMRGSSKHTQCWLLGVDAEMNSSSKHAQFIALGDDTGKPSIDKLNAVFNAKFGMRFMPNIIRYADKPIGNNDIYSDYGNIANNTFFRNLFKSIGYSVETLMRAYEAFTSDKNVGYLGKQEKDVNKKLKKVSEDFNRLYVKRSSKFKFEIKFESKNIYFSIYDDDTPLTLDYQSVGFRWFFDLYFNLLSGQSLERGDIILMDEPAMNLSVPGQIELRKFLKQFVIDSGVTVVLATHSPFLIDVDNLDELRVAELKDSEAYISNDFSAIDPDDHDSLEPIKRALMVNSCHIFDPDRKVIFVEGITDYNYLLAFKNILGIKEDIVFLPVKGVGNPRGSDLKEQQIEISKKLIAMRKHNPVLLVDGDSVGQSMKSVNPADKSALKVIALSDVDSAFKTVESLFDPADLKKYGLVDKNGKYIKHCTTSSNVKIFADNYEFSKTTLKNFQKLFEYLSKETN